MKILAIVVISLTLLICAYFVFLSMSAARPEGGVENGRLKPCPDKPNCVISEEGGAIREGQSIRPLTLGHADQWQDLTAIIERQGGKVTEHNEGYLRAEFRSRLFRFVDDLEVRLDDDKTTLHIRSGSRSGTSDLGVNRKRIETLREHLK